MWHQRRFGHVGLVRTFIAWLLLELIFDQILKLGQLVKALKMNSLKRAKGLALVGLGLLIEFDCLDIVFD